MKTKPIKIDSDRAWILNVKMSAGDCIEIEEHHNDSENECPNYIVVPNESIDSLVIALLSLKKQ